MSIKNFIDGSITKDVYIGSEEVSVSTIGALQVDTKIMFSKVGNLAMMTTSYIPTATSTGGLSTVFTGIFPPGYTPNVSSFQYKEIGKSFLVYMLNGSIVNTGFASFVVGDENDFTLRFYTIASLVAGDTINIPTFSLTYICE